MNRPIKYCLYEDSGFYVAQCLNVEVSSFGDTPKDAIANLLEAVELYFEDAPEDAYHPVGEVTVGQHMLHA